MVSANVQQRRKVHIPRNPVSDKDYERFGLNVPHERAAQPDWRANDNSVTASSNLCNFKDAQSSRMLKISGPGLFIEEKERGTHRFHFSQERNPVWSF